VKSRRTYCLVVNAQRLRWNDSLARWGCPSGC
jgi:hypothetical protein